MPEEAKLAASPANGTQSPQSSESAGSGAAGLGAEYASEFCPVCNRRLAARACKLICACGYYMSCSDYY